MIWLIILIEVLFDNQVTMLDLEGDGEGRERRISTYCENNPCSYTCVCMCVRMFVSVTLGPFHDREKETKSSEHVDGETRQ